MKRLPSWKLNIKRFVASYSIIRVMACHQNGIIAISTSLLPLIIGKLCIYNFDCCLHGLCKNRNYFRKNFFLLHTGCMLKDIIITTLNIASHNFCISFTLFINFWMVLFTNALMDIKYYLCEVVYIIIYECFPLHQDHCK